MSHSRSEVTRQSSSSKPILAVDIDEVLVPFLDGFLDYYKSELPEGYKLPERFEYYGILELATGGIDQRTVWTMVNKFLMSDYYQSINPVLGSVEAIKRLREKFSFVAITARQENLRTATKKLLNRHFENEFDQIVLVGVDNLNAITKLDAIRNSGAFAMIDDNPRHVLEAAEAGIKPILFGNYAWNQEKLPKSIERAANWKEVAKILL